MTLLRTMEVDLSPYALGSVHVGGSTTERHFLNIVEEYAEKHDLTSQELDRLVEVVSTKVLKMLAQVNPNAISPSLFGRILQNLLSNPDLTPDHLHLLVDGWCQEVLAPLQYLNSAIVDRFISSRTKPFTVMAQLAGRPDCPMALQARLWRMTRLVEGDMQESHSVVLEILDNPTLPSAFAVRLKNIAFPHLIREGTILPEWDGYKRAQADYPDIADLPQKMFVDVLSTLPIPDAWLDEMALAGPHLIWVAPGIRRQP